MNEYKLSFSFRVHHPTLDPLELSRKLGLRPKIQWKAGQPRKTPRGTPLESGFPKSYCVYDFPISRRDTLPTVARRVLKRLDPHWRTLRRIVATGGRLDFSVGLFSPKMLGERIDHQMLTRMGRLGIDLDLMAYPFKKSVVRHGLRV
jgi:hypothetical protein